MDKELYERLAEIRRDIAAEHNIPAFRVLHNETLRALATVKPHSLDEAARLKGVGIYTRNHYLRHFVELIRDYEGL